MSAEPHNPEILGMDAGGTMTDTFIVDEAGQFTIGKAQTTPDDESIGFIESAKDASVQWGLTLEATFPSLKTGIYAGTAMINRLLEHEGDVGGLIVTAGQEDVLRFERARQTYSNYSYSDRMHAVTHQHTVPFIPQDLIYGVRERVDPLGDVAIPLYEGEVRQAVRELLAKDIEYIAVNLLFSYVNGAHERRIRELAEEVMAERGTTVPLYLASELHPIRGDFMRVNTVLAEAYAAAPSREQILKVRDALVENGASFELRIMAGHGGTIGVETSKLSSSLISGPVGGVIGARYLADIRGYENLVCTDIGGTSFDLALITDGAYTMDTEPTVARYLYNQPMVEVDSVGQGTGSAVKINPTANRMEIGPESAGDQIGVCYTDGDFPRPTITDCNLVLGLLNPDYFLGGEVELDVDAALDVLEDDIATPIGLDVYEAADGAVDLMESRLRNQVNSVVVGKGYSPVNYSIISYGGGGPVHTANYVKGLNFQDVLVPTWAAAFSAFGCACGDYEYRFDVTSDIDIDTDLTDPEKIAVGEALNAKWADLRAKIIGEFEKSGYAEGDVTFEPRARVQYQGQLRSLEVAAPTETITEPADIDQLVQNFEDHYMKVYSRSATSPEFGYTVTQCVGRGYVPMVKPQLPTEPPQDPEPGGDADKGTRDVYWKGEWTEAQLWEMDDLHAGNRVEGLAIVESPATTFVVPPECAAEMDENRIFHVEWEAL